MSIPFISPSLRGQLKSDCDTCYLADDYDGYDSIVHRWEGVWVEVTNDRCISK